MEQSLTVGQLARVTGVPAKTIRYYEQIGALPAPRRSAAGYRLYTRRDVHRLLFMSRACLRAVACQSQSTDSGA